jgi:hypothetical protein
MSLPAKKDFAARDFSENPFRDSTQDTQTHRTPNETQGNTKTLIESETQNEKAKILGKPLPEYLRLAYEWGNQKLEDEEGWHSPCYFFAWYAKNHPEITNLSSDKAAAIVGKIMKTWRDMPANPWANFSDDDDERGMIDFMESWDAIRHLPFDSPLDEALKRAKKKTLRLDKDRGKLYPLLITVCAHLQHQRYPEVSFFLSCRAAASALGCHFTMVSSLLRFAVKDGYLRVVKKAAPFKKGERNDATEYRFPMEQLPEGWNE